MVGFFPGVAVVTVFDEEVATGGTRTFVVVAPDGT